MATNWNSVDVVWSIGFFFNIDCLLDWFKILHLQIKTVNTWVGSDIQNAFASVRRKLLGTRVDERYWATRHLSKGNDWGGEKDDWIKGCWESRDHSHRSFLIEKIAEHPHSNVLETGANCGPNLYLLSKRSPTIEMVGVDINPIAVQKGNAWFKEEGISNVKLLVGKADDLGEFEDKSFDVVFTDAVLIYVVPDKIEKVVREMLRVARRALIFLEWHCFDSGCSVRGTYVSHWMRDYVSLLKEFVPPHRIEVTKLPKGLWTDEKW